MPYTADFAVVSASFHNSHGHPRKNVIKRVAESPGEFETGLKAEIAVISMADSSAYDFPAQQVLDRLYQNYGNPLACIYSTEVGEETRDWHGMCHEANYARGVVVKKW